MHIKEFNERIESRASSECEDVCLVRGQAACAPSGEVVDSAGGVSCPGG